MNPCKHVVVAVACCILAGVASPASAYEIATSANCPNGYTYPTDRQLTFNYANLASFGEQLQFLSAGPAVADRISNIGGHTFDFITPYGLSGAAYSYTEPFDGLNEVGIADLSALGGPPIGYTETMYDDISCEIVESNVYMDDDTVTWYVPDFYGVPFYDAGMSVVSGNVTLYYARGPLLHELLHSLMFNHSDSSYSFMNYNVLPWANRGQEVDMVDPLPDDREGMRDLYGNADSLTDVGTLITWYNTGNISNGAALGKRLCKPSTGVNYSSSIFDPTCGVDAAGNDGSIEVCPGDNLYVRYALVNYGTTAVTLDEELWFSKNDWLNRTAGYDIVSPKTITPWVAAANSSYRKGRRYEVPSGLDWDTDYYPVLWLDTAGLSERSSQNNWIPLRATIHVKPQASCP